MSGPWQEAAWTVLDFETSGTDLENDRAVQAAVVRIKPDGVEQAVSQIINPGVEIPQGAIDVHGITNERAKAEGADPAQIIPWVAGIIEAAWANGELVIACNASFDITLLDRELRRHIGQPLNVDGALVLDPLLIDRACDTYRPGSRKLVDLASFYRVKATDAHDALGDCMTAARVVWRQIRMTDTSVVGSNGRRRTLDYSPLRNLSLPELQVWQAKAYTAWAENFQDYLRTKASPRQPDAVVDSSWPWKPLPAQEGADA